MDFFKSLKNRKGASGAVIGAVAVLTLAFIVASVSYMTPVSAAVSNPELPSSCGIDIALILDNSGSINTTELASVKAAAKDFVDAFLPLTPTNFAVVKFATNGYLVLDYDNDATTIKSAIDSISTTSGSDSYTNWDDGLKEAFDEFDNSAKPDLYVFISDGNPNRYGDPAQGSGSALLPAALAAAVARADTIKSAGIRIVTLGIGNNLNVSSLEELSYPDPAIVSDFDTLADDLADLANELCGGTVIVKKLVNGEEASGWHFDLTGASSTSNPANGDTDIDGNVIFDVDVQTSVNIDLTETLQGGYSFSSASCDDGQSGAGANGAVTNILVQKNGIVNCVFNNMEIECGNGILEPGEECEAPFDLCCDSETCLFESSQTECRPADGECDVPDMCTGSSDACPADVKSTEECRPADGDCDVAEFCDGVNNDCPPDGFMSGTVCRVADGVCDVPEVCTGSSPDCPEDSVREYGYVCDVDPGVCDADDICDGQTKECNEIYAESGTDCGICAACDGSGSCAYDETQDGDCSPTLCSDSCNISPDGNPFTWDYADDVPNECSGLYTCTENLCQYQHECHDDDPEDGIDGNTCGAECDQDSDCEDKCVGLTYNYDGLCLGSCACDYTTMSCVDDIQCTIDACDDETGCSNTPDDSLCDDSDVCTLDVCESEGCTHTPIDTTAPVTTKTLYPADDGSGCFVKDIVDCHDDEEDVLPEEVELTNGCEYVRAGTQVVLVSEDDLSETTQLHWIVWYKVNPEDEWTIDQQGVADIGDGEAYDEDVTITLDKDSYHLIEYWAVDECGVEEDHHYELDIVDSQGPLTIKTIGEPKDPWTPGENGDPVSYFYPDETANCWAEEGGIDCWEVTTVTPIKMECEDPDPHPVGEKMLCFNVDVDGEDETKDYCEEYGGFYKRDSEYVDGGVCCRLLGKRGNNDIFNGWNFHGYNDDCDEQIDEEVQGYNCYEQRKLFYFMEETEHNLQYYCVDKLGNVGEVDEEKFKVEGNRFEIPLFKKWNLISVPFTLLDDNPETVFSKIFFDGEQIPYEEIGEYVDSVWTYDPEGTICGQDWCVWTPGESPDNLKIVPGWGYWVLLKDKPEEECDYGWFWKFWDNDEEPLWMVLGGSLFSPAQTPPSRQLQSGWNLIGYYGNNWEDYDWGDFDFMCGEEYDFPDKLLYGSRSYCALNSLIDTQEGYPRWSSLWSYVNCGDHDTNWLGLNSCITPSPHAAQDKMYAGRGYWIELDVPDIYAPATNCIWNDDFECIWTGGLLI